jgi:hypothetical protein
MALPILLKELKANGYNVVHVVAAGERPTSSPEPIVSSTSDGRASTAPHALVTRQKHRIKKHSVSRHHPAHSWSQADQMTMTKRPFWVFSGY